MKSGASTPTACDVAPRLDDVVGGQRLEREVVDGAHVEAAVMAFQDRFLLAVIGARVAEANLHEEPVQLRFRQRIGAFELDRVLGRERRELVREAVAGAVDRHLPLLHRLEQRRLGAGRHAVDLVDQQQVGEDRALVQRERARRAG